MLQYEEVEVALELAVDLARSFKGMAAMWTGRSCAGHILIACYGCDPARSTIGRKASFCLTP